VSFFPGALGGKDERQRRGEVDEASIRGEGP